MAAVVVFNCVMSVVTLILSFILTRRARIACCGTNLRARCFTRVFLVLMLLGTLLLTMLWTYGTGAMATLPAANAALEFACSHNGNNMQAIFI